MRRPAGVAIALAAWPFIEAGFLNRWIALKLMDLAMRVAPAGATVPYQGWAERQRQRPTIPYT